jgi:hypothetical protein
VKVSRQFLSLFIHPLVCNQSKGSKRIKLANMRHVYAAVLAIFPLLAAARSTSSTRSANVNYSRIFGGLSANASIHYPGQADYNTTTVQRWSTWDEPTFAVTIKPATDEDVQYIVSDPKPSVQLAYFESNN